MDRDTGWPAVGRVLWRARGALLVGAVVGLVLAVVVVRLLPAGYAATLLVAPAEAPPRLALPARQGDALALYTPADTGGARDAAFGRYLARLTAAETIGPLLADPAVVDAVFPGHDREGDRLRPVSAGARIADLWDRLLGRAGPLRVDGAAAADRLGRHLKILPAADPRHRRVVLTHGDPAAAVALLGALDRAADGAERAAALTRIAEREAHLRTELADGGRLEARRSALFGLIAEVERQKLQAAAGTRYAALPISGPTAPGRPVRPAAGLVLLLGAAAGAAVGLGTTLLRRRVG